MTRQNYYKQRKERQRKRVDEEVVVCLVDRERRLQPRLGVRKLQKLLGKDLRDSEIAIGRDQIFGVLRKRGRLVSPLPKSARTTNSYHTLPVFRNLVRGVKPTGPNQIWVSDITHIQTREGYEYLSLIKDLYSHKIVGYHSSSSLKTKGPVKALKRALSSLPEDSYPIHHSDRGCQYCSHEYVEQLQKRGMPVSMTEENHCYENASAERLNGILKQEYGLGGTFRTRAQVRRAVEQAVWLYNNRRPHTNLGMEFPEQVHKQAA
jgi:transposase InsO family protein